MRIPRLILLTLLTVACGLRADTIDSIPLFRLDQGNRTDFHLRDDTRYVAFYFSASWCPPCRTTTPALVEEYQRMLALENMPVEIVLVCDDKTEKDMLNYIKNYNMPWPAVSWDARDATSPYAARGIPHLALVDRTTGEIIAAGTGTSGAGSIESVVARMREITGVTTDKPFQTGTFFSRYGVLIAIFLAVLAIMVMKKLRSKATLSEE